MLKFGEWLEENTAKTLERRLSFDHGLTINKLHHVVVKHGTSERHVVVRIPNRGYPVMLMKTVSHGSPAIESMNVKGDKLVSNGLLTAPFHMSEFETAVRGPVAATVSV